MRRRDFITLLGLTPIAWPPAVHAQQPAAMPKVGFVFPGIPESNADLVTAFRQGLGEIGYLDGQNVAIDYRWARNDNSAVADMIADLAKQRVAVIVATGNQAVRTAAKIVGIPIVFNTSVDPVEAGFVANLARPGGNVTGVTTMNTQLGAKWLGLFHDLLPNATRFAVLADPSIGDPFDKEMRASVLAKGWQIERLEAGNSDQIDTAFANLVQHRSDALMIAPGAVFRQHLVKLATLATRHAIPAVYPIPQFAEVGGLMSYGTDFADSFRQVGVYVGRILRGARPAELPVLQPTKFEFVLNLSTAKALGLTIPSGLLAIVDKVIE
jgi:putative ABC transport system substrate-binding protein